MSWAQQREQIRRAAGAGVRPRISALGSQILPLRGPGGQSAQLSRPNGALTRAGQYYYQLVGRQPPSRQFDEEQPLIRGWPSDYVLLRSGVKKLVRTLAPDGNYHLTKLGKAFFRDKYTEWLAHVPVRIRGRRKNGRPYEREDYLPVTSLNVGLQRQNDGLSEAQVARNVKQAVLAKLGADDDFSTLLELSGEQYFLDNSREWTLSSQTTQVVDDRVVVETSLRQPLGALRREVSYQLWKGDEILESAFERRWDKLCVPRQLAELLKLPLAEVLSDFDTICDRGWQDRGVSPKKIREFCVWRGAPMFFVNCRGQLMDSYQPVEKEAWAVAFTAWDGHAFFYKNARTVHLCDESERIQPRYRAERRDSTAPEFAQWLEWDGQLRAGHFWTRDLQGQGGFALGGPLPQGGHEEPVRVEGPAASGGRGRLHHQRTARGSWRPAGVDAEAGPEVPRAEAGECHLRGLHAAPESAAGVAAEQGADPGSAGRAVQALRGARGAGNL